MTGITHDEYVSRRINDLLNRPRLLLTASTQKSRHPRAITYMMPTPAKVGLVAMVPRRNILSAYLDYLAIYNPTFHYWQDRRPQELQDTDEPRLSHGLTPLWTYGVDRVDTTLSLVLQPTTIITFTKLAQELGIGAQQYVTREWHQYEGIRSTPLDKLHLMPPHKLTGYFLRALGVAYLVPRNIPDRDTLLTLSPWHHLKVNNKGSLPKIR